MLTGQRMRGVTIPERSPVRTPWELVERSVEPPRKRDLPVRRAARVGEQERELSHPVRLLVVGVEVPRDPHAVAHRGERHAWEDRREKRLRRLVPARDEQRRLAVEQRVERLVRGVPAAALGPLGRVKGPQQRVVARASPC